MTVRDVMSARVITIPIDSSVSVARETLSANQIQHLVVLDGKRVAGTIWDRDLPGVSDDMPVSRVMQRRVATISSGRNDSRGGRETDRQRHRRGGRHGERSRRRNHHCVGPRPGPGERHGAQALIGVRPVNGTLFFRV